MTGVAAYVVLVVVIPALLLGHQGQHFPPLAWWQAWRRKTAGRRATAPSWGRSRIRAQVHARRRVRAPQARTAPRVPLWSHSQPLDYEEAA